jgi:magnesium transporter
MTDSKVPAEGRQQSAHDRKLNLSELVDIPVLVKGERVGRLDELVIADRDRYAEVTHLVIAQPFGRPPLIAPWEKVASVGDRQVVLSVDDVKSLGTDLPPSAVLLKDYILDKKVLDERGREVEVVYDLGMTLTNGKLLVVDVDLSKAALLRRMRLGWLARLSRRSSEVANRNKVPWSYVDPLPEGLGSFKGDVRLKVLKEHLSELPPVDLADVLEVMGPENRMAIFGALDVEQASDALEALDPKVQRDLIASLDKEKAAHLVNEMTPGQAADLLAALASSDAHVLLELVTDAEKVAKVRAILGKQEERVIDFSTSGFLRFAPEMLVGRARVEFRQAAKGKDSINYIYVIDHDDRLLGVVDTKSLLLADDDVRLRDVMTTNVVTLTPYSSLRHASELFARYLFRALPVTDENGKVLGVLPYRDVVALRHRYVE